MNSTTTNCGTTRGRLRALLAGLCAAAFLLAGCTDSGGSGSDSPTTSAAPTGPTAGVLRVLGGSELSDMAPVLAEAKKATGVDVRLTAAGTLEGAEQVASGAAAKKYDATWFSSDRYLGLLPGGNAALASSSSIMRSPVVLGVRASKAHELGWDGAPPTWAQIGAASAAGKFTYGMTDPASSNSGFSALVGVATALAGGGAALDAARVTAVTPQLATFFRGQKLTSGSSGWLAQRFAEQSAGGGGGSVDGLVNYESVLLDLNARGTLPEKLTVVYPRDGVVSGDYPLDLLAGAGAAQQADYRKLVEWLRTPAAQQLVMERTHRRPGVPGVRPAAEFGTRVLVELPFPAQRAAADGLVAAYLDKARRPARTIYVLDTSGSMAGGRLTSLQQAFGVLSGRDATGTETFKRFRERETVTILPFAQGPGTPRTFEVDPADPAAGRAAIGAAVDGLSARGGTAIYDSLTAAYAQAAKDVAAHPDDAASIVLMTDGENTDGRNAAQFLQEWQTLSPAVRAVPTFAVLFGEGDAKELGDIATRTHGKVFDARTASLESAFKEIRGYQ